MPRRSEAIGYHIESAKRKRMSTSNSNKVVLQKMTKVTDKQKLRISQKKICHMRKEGILQAEMKGLKGHSSLQEEVKSLQEPVKATT